MDTHVVITRLAHADGGVFSRRAALQLGADPRELEALRQRGHLQMIRRGWYQLDGDPTVVAAVRAGGAVACVSALRFHRDVWVPPDQQSVHLRYPRHRGRGAGCRGLRPLPSPIRAVDPLPETLHCAARCLPADYLVAVLDSTLRMPRPYTMDSLRALVDGGPRRVHALIPLLDPLAGSGTESIVRFRLRRARIAVRSQYVIPGLGRVDLLVGDKLIIECDSQTHHSRGQRITDYRRDRAATLGDYRVMRLDYSEVLYRWDCVLAEILTVVRSDRHVGRVRAVKTVGQ